MPRSWTYYVVSGGEILTPNNTYYLYRINSFPIHYLNLDSSPVRFYLRFATEILCRLSNLPKVMLVSWDSNLGLQTIHCSFHFTTLQLKGILL